ncbi:MAG: hypothetical protein ACRCTU_18520 [Zoogloea sp.]|uniref:hypothetical protein n=1 Tax=Zoogloea sp. TaxID=49181 RepID=UPI003F3AB51A
MLDIAKLKTAVHVFLNHADQVSSAEQLLSLAPDLFRHQQASSLMPPSRFHLSNECFNARNGVSLLVAEHDIWGDPRFQKDADWECCADALENDFEDAFEAIAGFISQTHERLNDPTLQDQRHLDDSLVLAAYWRSRESRKLKLFIAWEDEDAPMKMMLEVYH